MKNLPKWVWVFVLSPVYATLLVILLRGLMLTAGATSDSAWIWGIIAGLVGTVASVAALACHFHDNPEG
jgi:hypothetical protein